MPARAVARDPGLQNTAEARNLGKGAANQSWQVHKAFCFQAKVTRRPAPKWSLARNRPHACAAPPIWKGRCPVWRRVRGGGNCVTEG
eukprot:15166095-Alexandrium_andersonii.AAC.1